MVKHTKTPRELELDAKLYDLGLKARASHTSKLSENDP